VIEDWFPGSVLTGFGIGVGVILAVIVLGVIVSFLGAAGEAVGDFLDAVHRLTWRDIRRGLLIGGARVVVFILFVTVSISFLLMVVRFLPETWVWVGLMAFSASVFGGLFLSDWLAKRLQAWWERESKA
jgi:hypothetical protein